MNKPDKAEAPKLNQANEADQPDDTELDETELDEVSGGTKAQQVIQMISNIIKAQTEASQAIIRNIRG